MFIQNYYLFISYILLVGFSKIYASVRQKLFPFLVPLKLLIKLNVFVLFLLVVVFFCLFFYNFFFLQKFYNNEFLNIIITLLVLGIRNCFLLFFHFSYIFHTNYNVYINRIINARFSQFMLQFSLMFSWCYN